MGQRTSRLGIAVLVMLFLASPAAAAPGEGPPALDTVRAVAERVAGWLEGIADRLTGSEVERRGKLLRIPATVAEAFVDRRTEAAPTPDPYG